MDVALLDTLALTRTRVTLGGVTGYVDGFRSGRNGTVRLVDGSGGVHELADGDLDHDPIDQSALQVALDRRAAEEAAVLRLEQAARARASFAALTAGDVVGVLDALSLSGPVRDILTQRPGPAPAGGR